jgi:hypothetical protein
MLHSSAGELKRNQKSDAVIWKDAKFARRKGESCVKADANVGAYLSLGAAFGSGTRLA